MLWSLPGARSESRKWTTRLPSAPMKNEAPPAVVTFCGAATAGPGTDAPRRGPPGFGDGLAVVVGAVDGVADCWRGCCWWLSAGTLRCTGTYALRPPPRSAVTAAIRARMGRIM